MRKLLIRLVVGKKVVIANLGVIHAKYLPVDKDIILINTAVVGGIPIRKPDAEPAGKK